MTDFNIETLPYQSVLYRGLTPSRSAAQIIDTKGLVSFRIFSLSRQNRTVAKTVFSSKRLGEDILHLEVLGLCVLVKHVSNDKISELRIPSKDEISEKLKEYNRLVGILSHKPVRPYEWNMRVMNEDDFLNRVRLVWRTLGIPAIRKSDSTKVTLTGAFSPVYIRPGEVYTIPRELQQVTPKTYSNPEYPWNREEREDEPDRRRTLRATEVWNEPIFEVPRPITWETGNTTGIWGRDIGVEDRNLINTLTWPYNTTGFTGFGGTGGVYPGTGNTTMGPLTEAVRLDFTPPTDDGMEQLRQRVVENAIRAHINEAVTTTLTTPTEYLSPGTYVMSSGSGNSTYITVPSDGNYRIEASIDPDVHIGNEQEVHRREMIEALTARYNVEVSEDRPAVTQRASVRQDRPFYRQGRF